MNIFSRNKSSRQISEFVYDPTQPEVCAEIEEKGSETARIFGHALVNKVVEVGLIMSAGYAIGKDNMPLFVASSVGAVAGAIRAKRLRNQIDDLNSEKSKLMDQLGVDSETYNEAGWRHIEREF